MTFPGSRIRVVHLYGVYNDGALTPLEEQAVLVFGEQLTNRHRICPESV